MVTDFTIQALSLLFTIEYGETRKNPFSSVEKHLTDYQVLQQLVCSGIIMPRHVSSSIEVTSFCLARPYSSISLLEVIHATGGTIRVLECVCSPDDYHRERNLECVKINAIDNMLYNLLKGIKIVDL